MFLAGCGENVFSYGVVSRDSYNTGGNLSFEYDSLSHTAYFGGEGEVLQWSVNDVAKGWMEKGARVGLKIVPPTNLDDPKSVSAILDGNSLEYKDFYRSDNNQYAEFYPVVQKDGQMIELKIKWQESAAQQTYNIVIRKGTVILTDYIFENE